MYLSEKCKKANIKSKKKILLRKSFLYVGNKDVFAYQSIDL